eukprot:2316272-Pleurochrysis_carterae.AAC.4
MHLGEIRGLRCISRESRRGRGGPLCQWQSHTGEAGEGRQRPLRRGRGKSHRAQEVTAAAARQHGARRLQGGAQIWTWAGPLGAKYGTDGRFDSTTAQWAQSGSGRAALIARCVRMLSAQQRSEHSSTAARTDHPRDRI